MLARHLTRIVLVAVAMTASACSSPQGVPPGASTTGAPAPAAKSEGFIVAPDLPPLNAAAVAGGSRSVETVRVAYEFAARHPEVLSYMPCFCGCQHAGHKHNGDCFVAGRTSDGAVTAWDYHGVGCAVCLDVARDAMQMHNSGATVTAIRSAIDKKYAAAPTRTPTPMPKRSGSLQDQ